MKGVGGINGGSSLWGRGNKSENDHAPPGLNGMLTKSTKYLNNKKNP